MVKDDTGLIYFDPDALCPGGAIVFRTYTYFPDNDYGNYVELITPESYVFKTTFREVFDSPVVSHLNFCFSVAICRNCRTC